MKKDLERSKRIDNIYSVFVCFDFGLENCEFLDVTSDWPGAAAYVATS